MVKVNGICKSFNGTDILDNVSFFISTGQKVGLVGKNGVGKSTLMRIISGIEEPSSGNIIFDGEVFSVGYLRQEFEIDAFDKVVSDYIDDAVGITALQTKLDALMASDLSLPDNIEEFDRVNEAFLAMDGYNFDYKKESTFSGLGLDVSILQKKVSMLSGGQKNKVLLSVVLLSGADLLLLDEPTNNLDMKSIQWLDTYLRRTTSSCLIISHDRVLLDHIVSKIIEIDENTRNAVEFTGNYSDYLSFKAKQQAKQLEAYESQQELIANLQKSVRQKKTWAAYGRYQGVSDNDKYTRGYERDRSSSVASNAKRIEKKIAQMDKVERPNVREPLRIRLSLSDEDKATVYIETKKLICGYESGFALDVGDLNIGFGDRVLMLGNNGTGKTTFIKTILSSIKPISGEVRIGSGVRFGLLLQQEFRGMSSSEMTIEDFIRANTKCETKVFLTSMISFGFSYEDRQKNINILSPGEITRLYLLICSLNDINVMVMDEPTNYLDVEALDALEEIVAHFDGTIIVSSHDRSFIAKFDPSFTLEFHEGKMRKVLH